VDCDQTRPVLQLMHGHGLSSAVWYFCVLEAAFAVIVTCCSKGSLNLHFILVMCASAQAWGAPAP